MCIRDSFQDRADKDKRGDMIAAGNGQLKVEQWSPQPSPSVDPAVSIFEMCIRDRT